MTALKRKENDLPTKLDVWLDDDIFQFINSLRLVALQCRAASRADLHTACAALASDRDAAATAHADILIRCLDQALGRRPVLHRPGAETLSFDEAWLAQLAMAWRDGDDLSLQFLLRSRVRRSAQREVSFLVRHACTFDIAV